VSRFFTGILVFDDQGHKDEVAFWGSVFQGMPFAAGAKGRVPGFDGGLCAVVAVSAGALEDVVGFAFSVVLVVTERTAGLQGNLGVKAAFSGKLFFAEQGFNEDMPFAASFFFGADDLSIVA